MKKFANWYWNHEASGIEIAIWLVCVAIAPLVADTFRSLGIYPSAMNAYVLMLLVLWVRCTRTIIIRRK